MRSKLSYILEQAILDIEVNPLSVDIENEKDWLGYYEAVFLLKELFIKQSGELIEVDEVTQDQLKEGLYHIKNKHIEQGSKFDDKFIVASHDYIVMVKDQEQGVFPSRLIGSHHAMIPTKELFKNKAIKIIVPFEIVTIVKPTNLGNINLQYAYDNNPLHPCFIHYLTPSPVVGLNLNNDINQTIGYVVHASYLGKLIGLDKDKVNALQFDTKNALLLLKNRYNIALSDDVINSISDFDEAVIKQEGQFCVEIHT